MDAGTAQADSIMIASPACWADATGFFYDHMYSACAPQNTLYFCGVAESSGLAPSLPQILEFARNRL
jgi:hypothetical protein